MRQLVFGIAALLLSGIAGAQNDTTEVSVKVIRKGRDSVIVDTKGQTWNVVRKRRNVETSWFGGIDLGFNNFDDHTNYASAEAQAFAPGSDADWFDLRNGKSVNVNIWIFNQKINIVDHTVNLKYSLGLELNNYRFKNPIRFDDHAPYVAWDETPDRHYQKNKLAADYITMPVMLNFDFGKGRSVERRIGKSKVKYTPGSRGWGFSAGVSAGYLYAARNKFITSDEGKQKLKDNFNLRPWKIAYIAEINLGYISLYGSYSLNSMFKNGLDMTPYSVGIRF